MSNQNEHQHQHQHKDQVLSQIQSLIEHLQTIQTMVKEDRPCVSVLTQLSGATARLTECRKTVAHDHIRSCLHPALKPGQEKVLHDVESILSQILSGPTQGSHH